MPFWGRLKRLRRPPKEGEPPRRPPVTTYPSLRRWAGFGLGGLLLAALVVLLVLLLTRGGGEPVSSPTTVPTPTSAAPAPTTTSTTLPATATTGAVVVATTTPPPPTAAVPAAFTGLLAPLGLSEEEAAALYLGLMEVEPMQYTSGPTPLGPDPGLQICRYGESPVSPAASQLPLLSEWGAGNSLESEYLLIVGEHCGPPVPGTAYQHGVIVSDTAVLTDPSPGEVDALGRIPGARRAWFGDLQFGGLDGVDAVSFSPFDSEALGATADSFFAIAIPVLELGEEGNLFLQSFGRATPEGAEPAATDPAAYSLVGGLPIGG
ncbi:MAG: hypothetical protein KJ956_07195 [Actinobacteria bacterium]|nr:hypothetical protein [Actinomycetota bacterium]